MKPISQRQIEFYEAIWKAAGENYNKYSKEMLRLFYNHFREHNEPVEKNTLMLWEKQKNKTGVWNLGMRLAQWKSRNERNGWGPKDPTKKDFVLPVYFNKTLWQKLPPEKIKEYKAKLINLGWVYSSNSIATYWRAPDKKIHWL